MSSGVQFVHLPETEGIKHCKCRTSNCVPKSVLFAFLVTIVTSIVLVFMLIKKEL